MPETRLFVQVGQRIGRGVVIDADVRIPRPGRAGLRGARLLCDCGNEYVSALQALVGQRAENQQALSCGCLRREHQIAAVTSHGMGGHDGPRHPLLKTWEGMIHRCEFPGDISYARYGARGITVCDRWHDPRLFAEDIERLLGPRPEGFTLDRIDNNGNYGPENVRWADRATQANNQRPLTEQDIDAKREQARQQFAQREFRTEVCEQCGGEYQTRALSGSDHLRFCSKKCKAKHRRDSGADDVERACHQCGATFTINRYDKKRHCSRSCAVTCQHAGGCPR